MKAIHSGSQRVLFEAMILAPVLLLATLVGPEHAITPPSYGPAFGTQYPHALVSDGTDFLAIWSGIDGVHAAVIDENGGAHPPAPRALFTGTLVQAAWAGDAYAVAWLDGQRTMFARLARDGASISAPVAIAEDGVPLAIASLDGSALVILTSEGKAEAVLVGANDTVQRSGIVIPTTIRPYGVSAAASGGGFVVASVETAFSQLSTSTTVRATRISASGDVEQSVKLVEGLPHNVNSIDAAGDGERVGVAFVARRNDVNGPQRLYAFTLDARTLAVTAHDPSIVTGDDPQVVPAAGGFAASMLAYENPPLKLTTVAFGSSAQHSTVVAAAPGADLYTATNGRTVMNVWRDYRLSPPYEYSVMNMFGLALDASATMPKSDVQPVALSVVAQAWPVIARGDATSLLAWFDEPRSFSGKLVVARVDSRGNALDAPIAIATEVEAWPQPVVVFTGEVWIVAWSERVDGNGHSRVFTRRVSRYGQLLDAAPVALADGTLVAGASNGTVTLLIAGASVYRFSRPGVRFGEAATISASAYAGSLASNGGDFLLAWNEGSDWWQFPSPNMRDVRAMRLDGNGSPIDVTPIDVATSKANEVSPFVTSDGTDFLIVYGHAEGSEESTVRAKRVLPNGTLGDHTATSEGSLVASGLLEWTYTATPAPGGGYLASIVRVVGETTHKELVTLDARGAATEGPVPLAVSPRWTMSTMWVAGDLVAYSRTEPALGNVERVYVRGIGGEGGRRRTIRK